jgi:hypothetical protein
MSFFFIGVLSNPMVLAPLKEKAMDNTTIYHCKALNARPMWRFFLWTTGSRINDSRGIIQPPVHLDNKHDHCADQSFGDLRPVFMANDQTQG